ncbi:LPS export ABC transporter periplasmic protein LptC [Halobacteriovorax sp. GB3]|uniref:LPS export ABC transporter periplasmic protein LptC n=1 Tax=Halobacteriovorax sp. GB3 TaxID=2719615 RepID=UPI00235E84BE|nr:LPS export ABC transporter periplasmic protein LptC [Halobacteriovorax sp. GB3]MDD0853827.1 LPS export ABC transporter periplasmic protein LptC [Halobacteriovorax sp. GB3]
MSIRFQRLIPNSYWAFEALFTESKDGSRMSGKRHLFIIGTFFLFSLLLIVAGQNNSWKRTFVNNEAIKMVKDIYSSESYFSNVNYFLMENEKPTMHLDSTELSIDGVSEDVIFSNPKGVFFTEDQKPIHYIAQRGLWIKKTENLILNDNIEVRHNDSIITTDKMTYNALDGELTAKGNVHSTSRSENGLEDIEILSEQLLSYPMKNWSRFLGNVRGKVNRKRAYEESIQFWSDQLELDMISNLSKLDGNVRFKKQRVTATSLRGEIFLENYNKKLKYFTLYDDVVVKERVIIGLKPDGTPGEQFERKAFSDKLEGFMKDRTLVLTGYPKVIQRGDVIKGNIITLREDSEIVEVDDANSNFNIR